MELLCDHGWKNLPYPIGLLIKRICLISFLLPEESKRVTRLFSVKRWEEKNRRNLNWCLQCPIHFKGSLQYCISATQCRVVSQLHTRLAHRTTRWHLLAWVNTGFTPGEPMTLTIVGCLEFYFCKVSDYFCSVRGRSLGDGRWWFHGSFSGSPLDSLLNPFGEGGWYNQARFLS